MNQEIREWMVGFQGHRDLLTFSEVARLIRGGQLRETEMVKRGAEPWRAAIDVPEISNLFEQDSPPSQPPPPQDRRKISTHGDSRESTARLRKISRQDSRSGSSTRKIRKTTSTIPKVKSTEGEKQATRFRKTRYGRSATRPKPRSPAEETALPDETRGVRNEDRVESATPAEPPVKVRRITLKLDPMVMKYFSVTDLTRHAAWAFLPRKLFIAALILVPVFLLMGVLHIIRMENISQFLRDFLMILSGVILIYGLALTCAALAFLTRRNLEGDNAPLSEVILYTSANLGSIVIYPLLALAPTLMAVLVLWLLGFLRNSGEGMAMAFRAGYLLFFILGLVAMSGLLLLELALCYIPSALAIDVYRLRAAVGEILGYVRRQTRRVVFHWLLITTVVVAMGAVMYFLFTTAWLLPQWIFGQPGPAGSKLLWMIHLHWWVALGLAAVVPVSVLSTFGTLSYLILKQEDEIYLAGPPDETASGDMPDETDDGTQAVEIVADESTTKDESETAEEQKPEENKGDGGSEE